MRMKKNEQKIEVIVLNIPEFCDLYQLYIQSEISLLSSLLLPLPLPRQTSCAGFSPPSLLQPVCSKGCPIAEPDHSVIFLLRISVSSFPSVHTQEEDWERKGCVFVHYGYV